MNKNASIRNLVSIFLIVLFGFSILPKKVLHDLLAGHKDRPMVIRDGKTDQFNAAGFHCNCESLVVMSPFLGDHSIAPFPALSFHGIYYIEPHCFLHSIHRVDETLRGPPAMTIYQV